MCAAYRDACLKYHPDKCGAVMMDEEAKEKCEERFKHIQEAYDVSLNAPNNPHVPSVLAVALFRALFHLTSLPGSYTHSLLVPWDLGWCCTQTLSDPQKRRTYDSMDDFNDHLPTTLPEDKDFYKVRVPPLARCRSALHSRLHRVQFTRWPGPEHPSPLPPSIRTKCYHSHPHVHLRAARSSSRKEGVVASEEIAVRIPSEGQKADADDQRPDASTPSILQSTFVYTSPLRMHPLGTPGVSACI